jgi:hypothetical protein
MNNWKVSLLYGFFNVLSEFQVVQKTLNKEYNWMVVPLYDFLSVFSNAELVQKT